MDGARLSRFPHLSWLRFTVRGGASRPLVVGMNGGCHTVSLTARGHHRVRWITGGTERDWSEDVGTVHFLPSDDRRHAFASVMSPDFLSSVLLLPRGHLHDVLVSEHMAERLEFHRLLSHDDHVLQSCTRRMLAADRPGESVQDGACDEAARRMILRLAELCGGGLPDWHDDASLFDRRTLDGLVAYVDDNLRIAPSLGDVAPRTGLSPSHFARKFRHSTGLSLHRFVNRRRIVRSLEDLRDDSRSLADVALDLGFSSQSHFTRLFSSLTGMTPARYRKQFRRTIG